MRYCSNVDEVLLGQAKVYEEWWREAKVDEEWWQEAKVDEVLPGQAKVDQVIKWQPRPGQSRNNGEAVALGCIVKPNPGKAVAGEWDSKGVMREEKGYRKEE
jgi:hypothetical protein